MDHLAHPLLDGNSLIAAESGNLLFKMFDIRSKKII